MEQDILEQVLSKLKKETPLQEPAKGHEARFLAKLNQNKKNTVQISWAKLSAIAASILLAVGLSTVLLQQSEPADQGANTVTEITNSSFYFSNLVAQQVALLDAERSPVTEKIISDTLKQLQKLETDHQKLELALANGGNTKMLLSAMITNFQTRIDLIQDVLKKIETIKTYKNEEATL